MSTAPQLLRLPGHDRIPVARPYLDGRERAYVDRCFDSGWISSAGEFIDRFERAFAAFCGTRHAVSCTSGTTALHLALAGLDIGPGDEVIVPDLTYIATANAVRYCNATPVFVDIEPRTMAIDPTLIEAAITPATRAIIVVHLFGHPAEMSAITAIAARHGLIVVEDAAQAHGARYRGRPVGSLGRCATFSFFGNKIITTGEGGAITTDDDDLAARLRLLRGQGMDPERRYWFPEVGFNYRMTNICAAVGLAQMERANVALARRRWIQQAYDSQLHALDGLIVRPQARDMVRTRAQVVLRDAVPLGRDLVMALLDEAGIETRPLFHPMHRLPPYAQACGAFPVATRLATRGLSLPTHEHLGAAEIDRVCAVLSDVLGG